MNRVELQELAEKEQSQQQTYRCRLLCCASTPCLSSGTTTIIETLQQTVKEKNLKADIDVVSTGCMGPCSRGPVVTLHRPGQEPVVYEQVTPELALELLERHATPDETTPIEKNVLPNDLPFFTKQQKIVLATVLTTRAVLMSY